MNGAGLVKPKDTEDLKNLQFCGLRPFWRMIVYVEYTSVTTGIVIWPEEWQSLVFSISDFLCESFSAYSRLAMVRYAQSFSLFAPTRSLCDISCFNQNECRIFKRFVAWLKFPDSGIVFRLSDFEPSCKRLKLWCWKTWSVVITIPMGYQLCCAPSFILEFVKYLRKELFGRLVFAFHLVK